jgi:hypothetical protein
MIDPISIIAVIIAVVGLSYEIFTRRKQIKQLEKERKRRIKLEKFLEILKDAQNNIQNGTKLDNYFFPLTHMNVYDIVSHFHNTKVKSIKLKITPKNIEPFFLEPERTRFTNKNELSQFKIYYKSKTFAYFKRNHIHYIPNMFFNYSCEPEILNNPAIEFVEFCSNFHKIIVSHRKLYKYKDMIDSMSLSLLEELERSIDEILDIIYLSVMEEHEIIITQNDNTNTIYDKLINEIIGFEKVSKILSNIDKKIIPELTIIKEKLFDKIYP